VDAESCGVGGGARNSSSRLIMEGSAGLPTSARGKKEAPAASTLPGHHFSGSALLACV